MEVVLERFALDVRRVARQKFARRMNALATRFENFRDRVLCEPIDLETRMKLAQLVGDRDVPLRMTETNRRRNEERTFFS